MNPGRVIALACALLLMLGGVAIAQDDAAPAATDQAPAAAAPDAAADDAASFADLSRKMSYVLGYRMGGSFGDLYIKIDEQALLRGIQDAMQGGERMLSDDEMRQAMETYRKHAMAAHEQEVTANQKEAEEFLAKNATAEGVKTTDSGLQYIVVKEGEGDSPEATDEVTVHYTGTLLNGKKFDSSLDRGEPATFGLNQVIPGWTEGLQLMKKGAEYTFFIPPDLAYGEQGRPGIPPNSLLKFDVQLIDVKKPLTLPQSDGAALPTPAEQPAE